ncbi:MAG TPA: hypothetical protein VEX86_14045, partial [Longimicrobium sp.]|nr:hypothetical protein [Longimicrobium sp.]
MTRETRDLVPGVGARLGPARPLRGRRMRLRGIAIALLCGCPTIAAAQPADVRPQRVYSTLWDTDRPAARDADRVLAASEILPEARRLWSLDRSCAQDFRVLDAADGAFTARGLEQRAVLYRYCEAGRDAARGGIAIVQAGRVVAHVTIERARPEGVRALLADIDQNGVAELMLVDSMHHDGISTVDVGIVQIERGRARSFGTIRVHHDNFDVPNAPLRSETSVVLSVTPGRTPVFEVDTYIFRDGMRARWVQSGKPHVVVPTPQRATYR